MWLKSLVPKTILSPPIFTPPKFGVTVGWVNNFGHQICYLNFVQKYVPLNPPCPKPPFPALQSLRTKCLRFLRFETPAAAPKAPRATSGGDERMRLHPEPRAPRCPEITGNTGSA